MFDTLTEKTRFCLTLLLCAVATVVVACAITTAAAAYDVHSCHAKGGHYTLSGPALTGTCSWAPEAGAL